MTKCIRCKGEGEVYCAQCRECEGQGQQTLTQYEAYTVEEVCQT